MQCGVCAGSCPLGQRLGTPAAEDLHDDPRRQARGGARFRLDVDVHLLLQLHRALPAQAADHAHHARPGQLRPPPRPRPEGPADARIRHAVLEQPDQEGPRQRTDADSSRHYFKDGFVQGIKKALATCRASASACSRPSASTRWKSSAATASRTRLQGHDREGARDRRPQKGFAK
jgi:hypothetical protein